MHCKTGRHIQRLSLSAWHLSPWSKYRRLVQRVCCRYYKIHFECFLLWMDMFEENSSWKKCTIKMTTATQREVIGVKAYHHQSQKEKRCSSARCWLLFRIIHGYILVFLHFITRLCIAPLHSLIMTQKVYSAFWTFSILYRHLFVKPFCACRFFSLIIMYTRFLSAI